MRPVCSTTKSRPESSGGATSPTGVDRPLATTWMATSAFGFAVGGAAEAGAGVAVALVVVGPALAAGLALAADGEPDGAAGEQPTAMIDAEARIAAARRITSARKPPPTLPPPSPRSSRRVEPTRSRRGSRAPFPPAHARRGRARSGHESGRAAPRRDRPRAGAAAGP